MEARHVGILQYDVIGRIAPDRQLALGELHQLRAAERSVRRAEPGLLAGEEAQDLPPDHDRVGVGQPARLAAEALAVQLRAVAAAEVGDAVPALRGLDAGVVAGHRLLGDREVVVGQPADRERAGHEHDALTGVQHGRGRAGESARPRRSCARAGLHHWGVRAAGRPHDEKTIGCRAIPPRSVMRGNSRLLSRRGARLLQDGTAVQSRAAPVDMRYLSRARAVSR